MKINNIQTYQYKYNYLSPLNNIRFGNNFASDTLVSHNSDVSKYDEQLALLNINLAKAKDKYGYYESLLFSKKAQILLLNRLENVPHIDFKKAKSLEDAKKFAFETFNIKQYDVPDLPTANFLNSALAHLCNISDGNIFMPDKISIVTMDEPTTRGEYKQYSNEIRLSDSVFNDKEIIDDDEAIANCSYQFRQNYELVSNALKRVIFHELGHCNYYSSQAQKYGQQHIDRYCRKLDELKAEIIKYNSQIEKLNKEKKKLQGKLPVFSKIIDKIISKFQVQKPELNTSLYFEDESDTLPWGENEKATALLISVYAAIDREEFIAETFAKMCMTDKSYLPSCVLKLYKESEGPIF